MNNAPRPGDTYVQSFARGLSVIQAFGPGCQRMTLTEVAKKTKLTRAGARRILLTLETLGFMQLEGRLFSMTPKIRELGEACVPAGEGVMTSTEPAPAVFRDAGLQAARTALERIERWHGEFPPTGRTHSDGSPVSYGFAFGSNGERDYMRGVARDALAGFATKEST